MVDALAGAKAIGPSVKAFQFIRYRRARAEILDDALLEALDFALRSVVTPDVWGSANPRQAARNLLEVLKKTEVPGPVIQSRWAKTKRWLHEFQTMRFPSFEVRDGPFDPRLQRWVTDALMSEDGGKAVRSAGLSPVETNERAHRVAKVAAPSFRRQLKKFDFKSDFDDKVRAELLLALKALDNSAETVLDRASRSTGAAPLAGTLFGGVTTAVTSTATDLPPVDSVGAGVVVAVLVTLGAGILLRRRPLTGPQFEVRRAVLGWLSVSLDQLYGLRPEAVTVPAVTACLERAVGRYEGSFGDKVVIDGSTQAGDSSPVLPDRHRLHELIGLADQVGDPDVQAALIALDAAAWSAGSRYALFSPIRDLVAALST